MTTSLSAQQLLAILSRLSFKLGQFKLASGATSDYYIACRITTLHADGRRYRRLPALRQNVNGRAPARVARVHATITIVI